MKYHTRRFSKSSGKKQGNVLRNIYHITTFNRLSFPKRSYRGNEEAVVRRPESENTF